MISEPITLYKLMILYMLNEVNFPLTNSQLTGFFLDNEYTTYFTLQQVLSELIDSKLITDRHIGNSTRYEISSDGEETLGFFGKDISPAIKSDMDNFLKANKFRLRSEVGTTADYYKTDDRNYIVHCEVREGKSILISFDISVPDEREAMDMVGNWKAKSQKIYSYVMKQLMETK
ncbi:MAG: DUF4364 family protein [Candidatus Avilachnospira sp.]|jgi:hypothetical protein